jgi:hypothetical protein
VTLAKLGENGQPVAIGQVQVEQDEVDADIAAFMDDDEGPDFNAAQQRAIDAYSSELLPTVLGGKWSRGKPGVPWSDQYSLELFDHPIWFRRREVGGPRSWRNCVVLGNPYRSEIADETGELTPDFLAAAQPLTEDRNLDER